jgi:hypothetical protein
MTGKKLINGHILKNYLSVETCCWICYSCFFLDEKVLMLPVVYEKYNDLLSMNINAEIYKFSFIILRHIQNTCIHMKGQTRIPNFTK